MPALRLETSVIATHDTFSLSPKDWRVFLGDRISSMFQRNKVAPDWLDVVQTAGVKITPERIAEIRAIFDEVRKEWVVPANVKKGGL